jgi:hypothetical protein
VNWREDGLLSCHLVFSATPSKQYAPSGKTGQKTYRSYKNGANLEASITNVKPISIRSPFRLAQFHVGGVLSNQLLDLRLSFILNLATQNKRGQIGGVDVEVMPFHYQRIWADLGTATTDQPELLLVDSIVRLHQKHVGSGFWIMKKKCGYSA